MTDTASLLTIAGTDPCGGAGIPVDIHTFRDWGYHGLSVVTAVVCQNTVGVDRCQALSADLVADQLAALLADVTVQAIKIGVIPNADGIAAVAEGLSVAGEHSRCPVVFDPVMASSAGQPMSESGAVDAMRERLVGHIDLITPNVDEAEALLGVAIESRAEFEQAAADLVDVGWPAVLVKAGHLPAADNAPQAGQIADVLATADGVRWLEPLAPVDADVRGTGCQLSSAAAAALADGLPLDEAVGAARRYLNDLLHERSRRIGRGRPVVVRI